MVSVCNSVKEIIPDCSDDYLRLKVFSVLQNFGIIDQNSNDTNYNSDTIAAVLEQVLIENEVLADICQMVVEDLFINGYEPAEARPHSQPEPADLTDDKTTTTEPASAETPNSADESEVVVGDTLVDKTVEITKDVENNQRSVEPSQIKAATADVSTVSAVDPPSLLECQCCFGESEFQEMISCCEGHLFCNPCLEQYVQNKIQDGVKQGYLECMENDCAAPFARNLLLSRLSGDDLSRLDDRIANANVQQANIDDLVRCPQCQVQFQLHSNEQVLACVSCNHRSCRHCKVEWTSEHSGRKCEELESSDTTSQRRQLEEKMTAAIVRNCPKCKTPLIKNQGCNKLTCSCGGKLCYICRKPNIGYDHFCQHTSHVQPKTTGSSCAKCSKCSLFGDPTVADRAKVNSLEDEAKFVADKNRLEKLIEMGNASQSAMDELLRKKKDVDEKVSKTQKVQLERPSTSNVAPGDNPDDNIRFFYHRGVRFEVPRSNIPADFQHPDLFLSKQLRFPPTQYNLPPKVPPKNNLPSNSMAPRPSMVLQQNAMVNQFPKAFKSSVQSFNGPSSSGYSNTSWQPNLVLPFPTMPPFPHQMCQPSAQLPKRPVDPLIPPLPAQSGCPPRGPFTKDMGPSDHALQQLLISFVKEAGAIHRFRDVASRSSRVSIQQTIDENNNSLLHLAVRAKNGAAVKSLVGEYGCNTRARNAILNSPLHEAAGLGEVDITRMLLEHGASVDMMGEHGRTALHIACAFRHDDVATLLVQSGANVNAVDTQGSATPLHLASYFGAINAVRLLISEGADLNIQDRHGNTPLDVALTAENADVVQVLLEPVRASKNRKRSATDKNYSWDGGTEGSTFNLHKRKK